MRLAALAVGVMALAIPRTAPADCLGSCSSELCFELERSGNSWAIVEAEQDPEQSTAYVVTAVHGGPAAATLSVGDRVSNWSLVVRRALLVVEDRKAIGALAVDDEDRVSCIGAMGSASREAAIAAALSGDCFAAANAAGLTGECREDYGCTAGAGTTATGGAVGGVLLALALISRIRPVDAVARGRGHAAHTRSGASATTQQSD